MSQPSLEAPSRYRRLVQAWMVAFGLIIAVIGVIAAIGDFNTLSLTTDDAIRRRLQLQITAELLRGAGLLGLFVFQARAFTSWRRYLSPFHPRTGMSRSVLARSGRQISGKESFQAGEVPRLRFLAQRQLDVVDNPLATVSLMVFVLGGALFPLQLSPDPLTAPTLYGRSLQVFCGFFLVILGVSFFLNRHSRRDATAFLDKTSELPR